MPPMRRPSDDRIAQLAVACLAASNLITNRLLPGRAYVPWNLALAGGLVALARGAGHTLEDLGLHPRNLKRASLWGAAGATGVAAVYAAIYARSRGLLENQRLSGLSNRAALWHLAIHIPLGTALAEEVVFRSVLPVLLGKTRRAAWAPIVPSLLFGLWHVLPSHADTVANGKKGIKAMALDIAAAVVATTLGGGLLQAIGKRAGHIAAPVALHVATNGIGMVAVRLADARR